MYNVYVVQWIKLFDKELQGGASGKLKVVLMWIIFNEVTINPLRQISQVFNLKLPWNCLEILEIPINQIKIEF